MTLKEKKELQLLQSKYDSLQNDYREVVSVNTTLNDKIDLVINEKAELTRQLHAHVLNYPLTVDQMCCLLQAMHLGGQ